MGFSQSVLIYVMSSYFEIASGSNNIGSFYTVAYVISLVIILNLHKIVRILGKANTHIFSLMIKIVALSFLTSTQASWISVFLLMIYMIALNIEWTMIDVMLETYSVDKKSGRIRGLHLLILNAGFLFGPLISSKILDYFGYHGIFIASFGISAVSLIVAIIAFRNVNRHFEQTLKIIDVLRKILNRKNILRIFYISFVLEFFYALMTIYMPLYLLNLGYSWDKIGIIFTIMLIPFVILQYPLGVLADKKFGEKEILIGALFLMGISTCMIYFTGLASLAWWAVILFLTRVGAASVEVLRDSYFFKRIDGEDVDIIDFFRANVPLAYIIGSIIASTVLILFPMKAIFMVVGVVVLSSLYAAFMLRDNAAGVE